MLNELLSCLKLGVRGDQWIQRESRWIRGGVR